MKKFSKESMQHFMLMHAEKLILGACLAATGLFVWMSMGEDNKPIKKNPSDLLKSAKASQAHIDKDDVWDMLSPHREGKASAKELIENATRVEPDKFPLAIIGSPTATLAPRQDPSIIAPEQLIAYRFRGGVMMDLENVESPLRNFIEAPAREEDEGQGSGRRRFQGSRDDDGYDSGDFGDPGTGSGNKDGLPEDYEPLDRGSVFGDVNAQTVTGLRPSGLNIRSRNVVVNVQDVVCVTAVVDFKKQSAEFEKAFADSVAYNAKRDRPVYQFVQIQRREIAGDKQSDWKDISEDVTYTIPQSNPLPRMPFQIHGSAPEVISPNNFDPILTQSIPAFALLDYQSFATHPALTERREFPAWEPAKKTVGLPGADEDDPLGFLKKKNDAEAEMKDDMRDGDGLNSLRRGSETEAYKEAIVSRKPGGQYRLVRFFDLVSSSKRSSDFEYRIRVWVGDPNQLDPSDGFKKNRGKWLDVADGNSGRDVSSDDEGVKFTGAVDGAGALDDLDSYDDNGGDFDGSGRREVVQDVQTNMLSPAVRKRIAAATDLKEIQEILGSTSRNRKPDAVSKLTPFQVAEVSEAGELEKIDLPPSERAYAYIQYLRFARPSAWSEPVRVAKKRPTADVLAGKTVSVGTTSVELGGRIVQFEKAEPSINVVVSSWIRRWGAKLTAEKKSYIGETMRFNAPAYVTDPISWKVLVAEDWEGETPEKFTLRFRTNETIVDAFYGKTQPLPNDKKQSFESPTEVLVMDSNGNLKVSNQFATASNYRNELALPDDSRFYGKIRVPKPGKGEEDDGYDSGDFEQ